MNKSTKKFSLGKGLTVLFASSACIGTQTSYAQEERRLTLDEIVVEARRIEENLQEVPVSLSAFTEQSLQNAGIDDIESVQLLTPGLTVSGGVDSNTARFYIRGVGTATPSVGVEPAVPIYIDDIYTPSGLGSTYDLFALDRVEVLRGPQGTLYGRNAFGGAVKIYTKSVKVDEAEGSISAVTGTESRRDIKAEYRAPIIDDKLWFGLGAAHLQHDGYQTLTNGGEGWAEDADIFKLRFVFEPTDAISLSLTYDKTDKDAPAKAIKVLPGTQGSRVCQDVPDAPGFSGILACPFDGSDAVVPGIQSPVPNTIADVDVIETDLQVNSVLDLDGLSWTAGFDITENISIKYLGATREMATIRAFDIDGGPTPFLSVTEDFRVEADSHELQLNADFGSFNLVAGLFAYDEETTSTTIEAPQPFLGIPDGATLVQDFQGRNTGVNVGLFSIPLEQDLESRAAYANLSWSVSEQLSISLGARYTEDEKQVLTPNDGQTFVGGGISFTGDVVAPSIVLPSTGLVGDPIERFNDAADEYSETTIELVADYRFSEDLFGYASFRQGFQAGQLFTAQGVVAPGVGASTEEQTVNAYEIGLKSTLLDGRMTLNVAAYYYDFEDLIVGVQTPAPVEISATGFIQVPNNAGEAETLGLETELAYLVSENLTLRATFAYTDFEINEVIDASTGINVADTFIDTFALTPEIEGSLSIDYILPVTDNGEFRLFGNVHYRDEIGINAAAETTGVGLVTSRTPELDRNFISDSLTTVNAGISYTTNDDLWTVNLIGKNLSDSRRPVATIADVTGFFGVLQQFNQPRTWELGITRKF